MRTLKPCKAARTILKRAYGNKFARGDASIPASRKG